jgi:hypothetical protein
VPGDLDRQVRRGAEPEQAQHLAWADAADPQRAVADDPGAQQRRSLDVAQAVRKRIDEVGAGNDTLGIAAVDRPPGELGQLAEVLAAAQAVAAAAACAGQPRQAHPLAGAGDPSHHLVPDDHRRSPHLEVAAGDLQVGAADAAGTDLDQQLALAGLRVGHGADGELPGTLEDGGAHGVRPPDGTAGSGRWSGSARSR